MLADVDVDEDGDLLPGCLHGVGKRAGGGRMIRRDGKLRFGEGSDQPGQALTVGADHVVGEKDVGHARAGQQLRLGQRGTLVFPDAGG